MTSLFVCGTLVCKVEYNGTCVKLPMVVVDHPEKPTLLGRNWLTKIKLNSKELFKVESSGPTESQSSVRSDNTARKYSHLFADSYDGLVGHKAHIRVKKGTKLLFCRPRRVSYALSDAVEAELDNPESNGVIEKVDRSDWASPIVVVEKSDKSVRICVYKVSVNSYVEDEQVTSPTTQDPTGRV